MSSRIARPSIVCEQQRLNEHPTMPVTRRQLLTNAAMAAAGAITVSLAPSVARADGNDIEKAISKALFPKEGFNAPDSVLPSADKINRELMSKPEVKDALSKLQGYQKNLIDLFDKFKNDPQAELQSAVRDIVPISELRNALNVVNEAIDENTQIETDKVVRSIIQDIEELDAASALKSGVERTQKKIDRTSDWFDKLGGDFKRLLSFYD